MEGPAIELRNLQFTYEGADAPVFGGGSGFTGINLNVPRGSRTLLLGANGVGKTTLLQILAGRHWIAEENLRVLGSSPFFDMSLKSRMTSRIALVDGEFPLTVDLRVEELLEYPTPGVDPELQLELLELLAIDRKWRMCRVSEGQRRRVQLLLALRKPCELLLLDEVTSHLDIVARSDLLGFVKERNLRSGMTIVYTTHILDGLAGNLAEGIAPWPTHILHLSARAPLRFAGVEEIPELRTRSLLSAAEAWIRKG